MNIRNKIESVINEIKKLDGEPNDIMPVLTHLDRAEQLHEFGNQNSDDEFYTDSIYRCNQVFEGILKVAYNVLNPRPKQKISNFEIENYFNDQELLRPRVIDLFSNYRKEWRNQSTHNYKLFFKSEEALLAIMTVSSFTYILLQQIHEEIIKLNTIINEPLVLEKIEKEEFDSILASKVITALIGVKHQSDIKEKKEYEVAGKITAFLESVDSNLIINRELRISIDNRYVMPDFVISDGKERLVLEIKGMRKEEFRESDIEQMIKYLWFSKTSLGVIFYYNFNQNKIEIKSFKQGSETYDVVVIK